MNILRDLKALGSGLGRCPECSRLTKARETQMVDRVEIVRELCSLCGYRRIVSTTYIMPQIRRKLTR